MAPRTKIINPFIYGPPVPPEKFIGRVREVGIILDRLANPYNRGGSMVSGPSGIGKTSLLHFLFTSAAQGKWKGLDPEVAHFAYIPTHLITPFSEIGFWEFLFSELEDWLGSPPSIAKISASLASKQPPSRFALRRFFTGLGEDNKFVVVLLDGFDLLIEEMTKGDSEAELGFLHALHALLDLPVPRSFSLITSSERELFDLFKDIPWFGSPFCSCMAHLPLMPFDEGQIEELLDVYLGETGVTFDSSDRSRLKQVSAGHPKRLQQEAYLLFDEKVSRAGQADRASLPRPVLDVDFTSFDVFLAHNSQDKPSVEAIAKELARRGLKPWFDKWHLLPGKRFIEEIERVLPQTQSVAVFVGQSGIGPWQNQEINAVLNLFVEKKRPVIPILLPNSGESPELPLFLRSFRWVRFASIEDAEALDELEWGITGQHPREDVVLENLVQAVIVAYQLPEVCQEVLGADWVTVTRPITRPNRLKAGLKTLSVLDQKSHTDTINSYISLIRQHKSKWDDIRREEATTVSSVVKEALKLAREVEENAIRDSSSLLKDHLEELVGQIVEVAGSG